MVASVLLDGISIPRSFKLFEYSPNSADGSGGGAFTGFLFGALCGRFLKAGFGFWTDFSSITTFALAGLEVDPAIGFTGLLDVVAGVFSGSSFFGLILTVMSGTSSPESFDLLLCDLAVSVAATQDFLFVVKDILESRLMALPCEDADSFPSVLIESEFFEEFDFKGDFDGLEDADEEPKLLEYDLERDGDVGLGAEDLTGLGEEDPVLDLGDCFSDLLTGVFSGLEEGYRDDCLPEDDVFPDKEDLGFLGGNFDCGPLGIFSGLDEEFRELLLCVIGDLSGEAGCMS